VRWVAANDESRFQATAPGAQVPIVVVVPAVAGNCVAVDQLLCGALVQIAVDVLFASHQYSVAKGLPMQQVDSGLKDLEVRLLIWSLVIMYSWERIRTIVARRWRQQALRAKVQGQDVVRRTDG
jgi:hypothetical protein